VVVTPGPEPGGRWFDSNPRSSQSGEWRVVSEEW